METALDIIGNALSLPRSDRSYLAVKLIESLDEEKELPAEVLDELSRRSEAVKSGEVKPVSLDEVRGKVQQILRK